MEFEWDPDKDATNQTKHGVSFVEAAAIFKNVVLTRDDPRDYGEVRHISIGHNRTGDVYVVVWTQRGAAIRLISAWKAGRNDKEVYERTHGPLPS